jgi:hypothetical protein
MLLLGRTSFLGAANNEHACQEVPCDGLDLLFLYVFDTVP